MNTFHQPPGSIQCEVLLRKIFLLKKSPAPVSNQYEYKEILRRENGTVDLPDLGERPVTGLCEPCNKLLAYMNGWEFLTILELKI